MSLFFNLLDIILVKIVSLNVSQGMIVILTTSGRIAWRILKDWVEAQMALLDIEMVRFEEIFLPYIETDNGQTIYERLEERQFLLEG